MKSFRRWLALAVAATISAAGAFLLAAPANAQPVPAPIGPRQYFAGEVNGNIGQSVLSVLGCPSPVVTGAPTAYGHPMPRQTVEAFHYLVPPPVPVGSDFLGYTGTAHKVRVDLVVNVQMPPIIYLVPIAVLTSYNTTAPIPTTLSLPCNATYGMLFTPVNGGPAAQTSTVNLALEVPHIVIVPTLTPRIVLLEGSGFVPSITYTIAECPQTSWVVPQNPCVNTNDVTVKTDTTGAFTHSFVPASCTMFLPSSCWIGAPTPQGVDIVVLAGAAHIIAG